MNRPRRSRVARPWRALTVLGVALLLMLSCVVFAAACEDDSGGPGASAASPDAAAPDGGAPVADSGCVPACAERACGDDGCGGSCGTCEDGATCSLDGVCVPDELPPPGCDETCESLGLECGEHCGEVCGECEGTRTTCEDGMCVCAPDCAVTKCEQDDGCGGACGLCPRAKSCEDCVLQLSVVDQEVVDGVVRFVTLALDFAPPEGAPLPGMADVRLRVEGDATLMSIATGEALIAADKSLHIDANTGRPFRELPDGVLQVLALSTANTSLVEGGRWLFFRFRIGGAFEPATGPASFSIVAREQIFAPPPADAVLWGQPIDGPVVVWPEAVR